MLFKGDVYRFFKGCGLLCCFNPPFGTKGRFELNGIQGGFAKMSDLGAKMPNLGQKRLFEVILGSFEVT